MTSRVIPLVTAQSADDRLGLLHAWGDKTRGTACVGYGPTRDER